MTKCTPVRSAYISFSTNFITSSVSVNGMYLLFDIYLFMMAGGFAGMTYPFYAVVEKYITAWHNLMAALTRLQFPEVYQKAHKVICMSSLWNILGLWSGMSWTRTVLYWRIHRREGNHLGSMYEWLNTSHLINNVNTQSSEVKVFYRIAYQLLKCSPKLLLCNTWD